MVDSKTMEKYAELVLRMGVNIQKDQPLLINAPIEGVKFVRIVVRKAYELGARDVHVNWSDDELSLLKYTYAKDDVLASYPNWRAEMQESFVEEAGALLSIHATNPDLLKEIEPERVAMANKAAGEALVNFRKAVMNDDVTWTVISIPTADWAQKIFPSKSKEDAVTRLWQAIIEIVRVDQPDPMTAWKDHNSSLQKAHERLNEKQYDKLVFKAPGTDLEVGLPKGHIWQGGAAVSTEGITFNPNIPTEEVFSVPDKYNVNGTVTSTKPLNYGGSLIDNFTLVFKDGKVIDFSAEKGEDVLKHLLEADEGSNRLGEVALVPHESPISKSNLIFYNTLYDENASCHIALGKAYPTNLENGATMSLEELDQHGVNDSLVHVDFMIGSSEMTIDGIKEDGTVEEVFRNGTWA